MGRPKGSLNKATHEVKRVSQRLIRDREYRLALAARLKAGTAGAMEPLLWHYGYGKPKETTTLENPDGSPCRFTLLIAPPKSDA